MPEEVLFESENRLNRQEVATYLRTVSNRLDGNETLTFSAGEQSIELEPPANLEFEVKVERETGAGPDELSLELELEWDDVDTDEESVGDKQTNALDIS